MPNFSYTPQTINDRSTLSEGWHPAMLIEITTETTPETWQMAKKSPLMWRWNVAVWESEALVGQAPPEHQSIPSSQTFSPGGRYQPSKAYVFACRLLARTIPAGETVSLDPLMPLPCRVLVSRRDKLGQPIEFANLTDLQGWPEGSQRLTADLKARLATWWQMKQAAPAQTAPAPTPQPAYATPAPAAQNHWAQPAQTTAAPAVQPVVQPHLATAGTTKPTW